MSAHPLQEAAFPLSTPDPNPPCTWTIGPQIFENRVLELKAQLAKFDVKVWHLLGSRSRSGMGEGEGLRLRSRSGLGVSPTILNPPSQRLDRAYLQCYVPRPYY